MPALLLLAATLDPRLAEPLRLLAEVRTPDSTGQPLGPYYASLPDTLHLTLRVAPLPLRAGAYYQPQKRVLTVAEALMAEDPRVFAAGLVHELRHASDFDLIALGLRDRDCIELEARAFEAQAKVTRAFWPEELPGRTDWEKGLAMIATTYEDGGATCRPVLRVG